MLRLPSTKCFSFGCLSIGYFVETLISRRWPMREHHRNGPMMVKTLWRRRLCVVGHKREGVKYWGVRTPRVARGLMQAARLPPDVPWSGTDSREYIC